MIIPNTITVARVREIERESQDELEKEREMGGKGKRGETGKYMGRKGERGRGERLRERERDTTAFYCQ